jgi:hypothetical protein
MAENMCLFQKEKTGNISIMEAQNSHSLPPGSWFITLGIYIISWMQIWLRSWQILYTAVVILRLAFISGSVCFWADCLISLYTTEFTLFMRIFGDDRVRGRQEVHYCSNSRSCYLLDYNSSVMLGILF